LGGVTDALVRTVDFEVTLAGRSATSVERSAGGFAVRHRLYPASYLNNQLYVLEPVEATALLADADRLLSGLTHRQITVLDDAIGLDLAPTFDPIGFIHGRLTIMAATTEPPPATAEVREVSAAMLRPAVEAMWRRTLPAVDADELRQLVERGAATEAACSVTRFAVWTDGSAVAWCELYRLGDTAQIENVVTLPEWRNRGFARSVVGEAMRAAGRAGCDLLFLAADLDDWPKHLYWRLGFREVGRRHVFARA
jgi:ribosomal protein S18 acetylase RimI-like enzyme